MTAEASIRANLQAWAIPPVAVEWLLMVWEAIQVFDDYADGDPVDRKALDALIWNTLVAMPQNAFFSQHAGSLTPIMASMVMKWQGSDTMERNGEADARSFVWRAGYYDLILMVFQLVHGPALAKAHAHEVLKLYGESFEDYKKEFANA